MKRIICMLLVLMFCMYLPMPAIAATDSIGGGGHAPWYCPVCGEYNTGDHCSTPGCPGLPGNTPQTGDASMINIWVIVMVVALVALVVAVVLFRRSKKA